MNIQTIKYKAYWIQTAQYFHCGHWFNRIYIQDPQLRIVHTAELKSIHAAKLAITKRLNRS